MTSASVKPKPIPIPSKADLPTLFFEANASARPKMMQFTTMSGMKMPNDFEIAGANAFSAISTAVNVCRNADFVGNEVSQQRYDDVRCNQNHRGGKAHANAVDYAGGNGQGGAHS